LPLNHEIPPPGRFKLEWLRGFLLFAEELNFTHAARALHISQPALHEQISKLAEALSLSLYFKQGRSLILTEDGQRLRAFARDLLGQVERFQAQLKGEESARPILCAGEGTWLYLLGERLLLNPQQAPKIMVRDAPGCLQALRSGEAHLGVLPLSPERGMEGRVIQNVGQALLCPLNHPLAKRREIKLHDLEELPLLLSPRGAPQREELEILSCDRGFQLRVVTELRGWPLTLRLAALGVGLAVINDFCPAPPGMRALPIQDIPKKSWWLMRREGRQSPAINALWDQLSGPEERESVCAPQ